MAGDRPLSMQDMTAFKVVTTAEKRCFDRSFKEKPTAKLHMPWVSPFVPSKSIGADV